MVFSMSNGAKMIASMLLSVGALTTVSALESNVQDDMDPISLSQIINEQGFIMPPMVNIPAGEFVMGTDSGDTAAQPAHDMSVDAFQMAKYPVTAAEFRMFIEDSGYEMPSTCSDKFDRNWLGGPNEPGEVT